jgi:hypothetical protein
MVYARPPNRNGIARSIQVKRDRKSTWGEKAKKAAADTPPRPKESGGKEVSLAKRMRRFV